MKTYEKSKTIIIYVSRNSERPLFQTGKAAVAQNRLNATSRFGKRFASGGLQG